MDRAKSAYEAQRAKWTGLFNKMGDHPTLAYVLHEGAAQMNVDNLDLTNANDIQTFLTSATRHAAESFAKELNQQSPLQSASIHQAWDCGCVICTN